MTGNPGRQYFWRGKGNTRLRNQVVGTIQAIWLLVLLILAVSTNYFISRSENKTWQERQTESAQLAEAQISAFMRQVRGTLETVGQLDRDYLEDNPAAMQRILKQNTALLELIRLDITGATLADAYQDNAVLGNLFTIPQSQWFQDAVAGKEYASPIQLSASGDPYLILAVPAADGGVVAARLHMDLLRNVVSEIHFGQTGRAYVVSAEGQVIAYPDTQVVLNNTSIADRAEWIAFTQSQQPEWRSEYTNLAGRRVSGTITIMADTNWRIVTELDRAETHASSRSALWVFGGGSFLILMLMGLATPRLMNWLLLGRIEKLRAAAEGIGQGDLSRRLPLAHQDEIDQLAGAFNEMANHLERMIGKERDERQRLQDTVQRYVDYMSQVARGNLAVRLTLPGSTQGNGREGETGGGNDLDDPLLVLGNSLNDTVASLQSITYQVYGTSSRLATAATEIMMATTQQARGAGEQETALAQIAATIDQVSLIVEQSAQKAQGVADLAQYTAQVSQAGQQAVIDAIQGVGMVRQQVERIAARILALSEQNQAIGRIIATVNEIAAQSNLLALNAAVEAARAGVAGRGFAVVADEVRRLSEQSRTATEHVKEILSQIQQGVQEAATATEIGVRGASEGVELVNKAGESIRKLATGVYESAQSSQQIAAAATQQRMGIEQIATAMKDIRQATIQATVSSRQSEHTAGEMNDLAGQLREAVAQYQL